MEKLTKTMIIEIIKEKLDFSYMNAIGELMTIEGNYDSLLDYSNNIINSHYARKKTVSNLIDEGYTPAYVFLATTIYHIMNKNNGKFETINIKPTNKKTGWTT